MGSSSSVVGSKSSEAATSLSPLEGDDMVLEDLESPSSVSSSSEIDCVSSSPVVSVVAFALELRPRCSGSSAHANNRPKAIKKIIFNF